ncbi:MAG: hypothetical protein ABI977_30025 [Acidobacteriota bacterium]
MAKKKSSKTQSTAKTQPPRQSEQAGQANWKRYAAPAAIVLMLSAAASIFFNGDKIFGKGGNKPSTGSTNVTNVTNAQPGTNTVDMGITGEPIKMNVAQAVMVTVDLDFGGALATIPEAIQQIERGYQPDDGAGRTFAILDAYGEPQPDGKLRMSMHVSSEKPGMATLKFKRTGELLWRARIGNPGDPAAGPKNLSIFLDKGLGNRENYVLDGTKGGSSVLDVFLQNSQQRARDVWPDGTDREVTFVYSACGCPVKVMCRRIGDKTMRTSLLPVIFPDDPAAVTTISNLMKW